jgi:hypothetical protein
LCGGRSVISLSPNRIFPADGLYKPVSTLKNVVLPAPFGPIKETIDLFGMLKLTSFTARSPPNATEIFFA